MFKMLIDVHHNGRLVGQATMISRPQVLCVEGDNVYLVAEVQKSLDTISMIQEIGFVYAIYQLRHLPVKSAAILAHNAYWTDGMMSQMQAAVTRKLVNDRRVPQLVETVADHA